MHNVLGISAHERRTPLQPIVGFLNLLMLDADQYLIPPDVLEILKKKVRTYLEMEWDIVNKILAISILESVHDQFRPPMEQVVLRNLIDLVILQGKYSSEAQVTVNVPEDAIITSDGAFIFEIMNTHLSNAVTYSHQPRQITITSVETDTLFRLSVIDNGIGIPAEKLEAVFEPFFISDADKLS